MSRILLSGASGFIGSHVASALEAQGHAIVRLARDRTTRSQTVQWDPEGGRIDADALSNAPVDAVVNLAGEPIARRWTTRRRRRIRESRVFGTAALSRALAALPVKPKVLLSGSAIGYYGSHRGDELLDENSSPGTDFLAATAHDWEQATQPASAAGIRVVLARTGLVLGNGGMLDRMLPPFRLGVGGRLGNGEQWMSWIALDDIVRAMQFLLDAAAVHGPVNLVAPAPVRNAEFTKTLARVLHRPAVLAVPSVALELLFGTMADNTILASQRVVPKRLADAGFEFRHPRLEEALHFELTR